MPRRALATAGLVAAAAAGGLWLIRHLSPPLWHPPGCSAVAPAAIDGVVTGVVRRAPPDCGPAAGAAVFLDAYFRPMGESDDANSTEIRRAVRDEKGAWKWLDPARRRQEAPLQTTADEEGRFAFADATRLRDVTRGKIQVWATLGDQVAPKEVLAYSPRPTSPVELVLGPSFRPRVRVRTLAGEPVHDAYVEVDLGVEHPQEGESLRYRLGGRSDGEGEAALPAVPVRPDWTGHVGVNPRDMPRFQEIGVRPGSGVLEFRISRGFTIRGKVLLPDGSPGSGVLISSRAPFDPDPNDGHTVSAADDGTFEVPGVPTRDAIVRFVQMEPAGPPQPGVIRHVSDHAPARLTRTLSGQEGEVTDLGTVALPASVPIAGVVLGPDGKPAGGGYLFIDGVGHGRPIDSRGRFRIDGVEPGTHSLQATIYEDPDRRRGELTATVDEVEAGTTDVVIHVTGAGVLVVRFHPAGDPSAPLEVRGAGLRWERGSVGFNPDSASPEIRHEVGAGPLRDLVVAAEGYAPKSLGTVRLFSDRSTVLDVTLDPLR